MIIIIIIIIIIILKNHIQKKRPNMSLLWAMFTKCSFDKKENKLDDCRRKDCIKKLCKKFKKRAMKIMNYEKKEMIPLTYEENKSYKM